MHAIKNIIVVTGFIFGLIITGVAADAEKQESTDSSKELKNQTHCPVMGGKIDSTVFTEIQGQRVYHCCPICSPKLKADPDKYFKKAAEEKVLFENIQTTCPVSGEKLEDKSVYTDYEGRRIVFCCKKCCGTFNENPPKYLEQLDEAPNPSSEKTEGMEKMDHSDHNEQKH